MLLFSAVIISHFEAIFGMDIALYSIIYQFCNTQVINTLYKNTRKRRCSSSQTIRPPCLRI